MDTLKTLRTQVEGLLPFVDAITSRIEEAMAAVEKSEQERDVDDEQRALKQFVQTAESGATDEVLTQAFQAYQSLRQARQAQTAAQLEGVMVPVRDAIGAIGSAVSALREAAGVVTFEDPDLAVARGIPFLVLRSAAKSESSSTGSSYFGAIKRPELRRILLGLMAEGKDLVWFIDQARKLDPRDRKRLLTNAVCHLWRDGRGGSPAANRAALTVGACLKGGEKLDLFADGALDTPAIQKALAEWRRLGDRYVEVLCLDFPDEQLSDADKVRFGLVDPPK